MSKIEDKPLTGLVGQIGTEEGDERPQDIDEEKGDDPSIDKRDHRRRGAQEMIDHILQYPWENDRDIVFQQTAYGRAGNPPAIWFCIREKSLDRRIDLHDFFNLFGFNSPKPAR